MVKICFILLAMAGPAWCAESLGWTELPACSSRAGIRATRSELVQFGGVSASISAQAVRDGASCTQKAALWVTRAGVSQELDLPGGYLLFNVVDVSPDESKVLIEAAKADDTWNPELGVVSLSGRGNVWKNAKEAAGMSGCAGGFEPMGFLDGDRVLVRILPPPVESTQRACTAKDSAVSVDFVSGRVMAVQGDVRLPGKEATVLGDAVESCKADPDVIGGCYTTRARLQMGEGGGLVIWPVGSTHLFRVAPGMVPEELRSRVNVNTRVYATMLLCPMTAGQPARRPSVCVQSARDFKAEAAPKPHPESRGQ